MRRALVLGLFLFLSATGAHAHAHWYCSAGLSLKHGIEGIPQSSFTFELLLEPEGQFRSTGREVVGIRSYAFSWKGRWIKHDGAVNLIGLRQFDGPGRSTRETRASSTLIAPDVLMLSVADDARPPMTVRCLAGFLE